MPEKYNESFFKKIKNFFKNLFSSKTNEENIKQQVYGENKENVESLQKKYETGEILSSNFNDEQYEKIVDLYKEQINNIKANISEKENRLKKAII